MHDKFIVAGAGDGHDAPARALAGSVNFATEGITEQAKALHPLASPRSRSFTTTARERSPRTLPSRRPLR